MRGPRLKTLQKIEADFNAKFPVGTEVDVRRDSGDVKRTRTRSAAWIAGGHSVLVSLEGISGGYDVDRVSAVTD